MKFDSLKGLIKYVREFTQFAIWSIHKIMPTEWAGCVVYM